MTHTPPTPQQLDEYAALDAAATPGPWHLTDADTIVAPLTAETIADVWEPTQASRNGEFIEAARTAVPALLADNHRLRDRIAELEGPAVEARAALAALCYDLDDPGTAALGALYLLQQATTGVEAPRDDAAQALAKHDAEIMRRCATFVRDTYEGDWADDAAATLERDADITERGCPGFEKAPTLATCTHCGKPHDDHADAVSAPVRP